MTLGNSSSAVMQQRRDPSDSFDYFPTPPWATRALLERLDINAGEIVAEPACGQGHMARPLRERFETVYASDIQDMGFGEVRDYLFPGADLEVDWTITNPPFKLAEQFIKQALRTSRVGVAMLVRIAFLEGISRYKNLFLTTPPTLILPFVERVPMVKGRVDPKVSSATMYCWMVWAPANPVQGSPRVEWIAPCRKRLERPGDYELPGLLEGSG